MCNFCSKFEDQLDHLTSLSSLQTFPEWFHCRRPYGKDERSCLCLLIDMGSRSTEYAVLYAVLKDPKTDQSSGCNILKVRGIKQITCMFSCMASSNRTNVALYECPSKINLWRRSSPHLLRKTTQNHISFEPMPTSTCFHVRQILCKVDHLYLLANAKWRTFWPCKQLSSGNSHSSLRILYPVSKITTPLGMQNIISLGFYEE